jgi:hypothetical protein
MVIVWDMKITASSQTFFSSMDRVCWSYPLLPLKSGASLFMRVAENTCVYFEITSLRHAL